MRKLVFIIFVAMVLFVLNLSFYIISEDYRFFIKKIKYSDQVVYNSDTIDDSLVIENEISLHEQNSGSQVDVKDEKTVDESYTFLEELDSKTKTKIEKEDLVMTDIEKNILSLFNDFSLKKLEKHASLFDITTEYPDEYFEFYSRDIILYFFSTKSYSEVYDIFDVLSYELPYDVNEVNNFGQASFYINLKEVYTDEFVRLVVQYKNTAFGLKINKDRYNEVKQVLQPLKPQK